MWWNVVGAGANSRDKGMKWQLLGLVILGAGDWCGVVWFYQTLRFVVFILLDGIHDTQRAL